MTEIKLSPDHRFRNNDQTLGLHSVSICDKNLFFDVFQWPIAFYDGVNDKLCPQSICIVNKPPLLTGGT